jgi:hypothetical protein
VLPRCSRCQTPFHPEQSSSVLRLTYCGAFCEQADLGFSIDGLMGAEVREETAVAHDAFSGEWLDELLGALPDRAEERQQPLGFRADWIMYGPVR